MAKRRLTYDFVKEQFEKEDYILLTKEYIDSQSKLDYICPRGHKHNISWSNWSQGKRCKYCNNENSSKKYRLDIKTVKRSFEKEKYKLLTKEYKNNHQKLDYICPKGHKHNIIWINWKKGRRCPYCAGNAMLSIRFIKSEFAKESYILLTKKYRNCDQKLEYICDKGHKHAISWDNWQQGKRCTLCKYIKHSLNFSGIGHWNWKNYSEEALKEISNYKAHVLQLTEQSYKKYKDIINPLDLNRSRNNYQLDHIYSVMEGFRNNIPAEIIANPNNLQMLLENVNIAKSDRSDISLEELYNRYNNWRKKNAIQSCA
jgi:hypothetical protein